MFCGSQVQAQLNWVLSSGPQKVVIKVSAGAVVSSGSWTGEESTSKLAQAVGRIHFLTIGPRAQDSNWLSTGSHPQLLKASPSFLLHGPPPPPVWLTTSLNPVRKRESQELVYQQDSLLYYNIITGVTSITFAIFYQLEASHSFHSHSRGVDYTRM